MKNKILCVVLLILTIATGSAWSLPLVNTAGDGSEDIGDEAYAYYENTGEFMFLGSEYLLKNELGNAEDLLAVQNAVVDWLKTNTTYDTEGFSLVNTTTNVSIQYYDESTENLVVPTIDSDGEYVYPESALSGTYDVIDPLYGIEFYAVKAGTDFAMYFENPAENYGSWSTYDLLANHPGETLSISHFTGYNQTLVSVPDASLMYLLGPALLGLGILGRRRKA